MRLQPVMWSGGGGGGGRGAHPCLEASSLLPLFVSNGKIRTAATALTAAHHDAFADGQLWALYRKLFPAPPTPPSPTPEKIRIVKKLYGCHDDGMFV